MARLVAPLTDQEIPATLARDDEVAGLLADKEPLGAYRPGGTDVAVADGGTGASSASAARTNLGLGNVDDISAMDMPVSTAQGVALAKRVEVVTVDDLTYPTFAAHRGGLNVWPENTLQAFRGAYSEGVPCIELDTQLLGDRTLGVMHDSTIDRVATGTGNVVDQSRRSWLGLTLDAGSWHGGGWGNISPPPTFEQVLDEFGGRVILLPEAKNASTYPAASSLMIEQIQARKLERSVIVQSFTRSVLDPFISAEIPVSLVNSSAIAPATLLADGVEWVLLDGSDDTHLAFIQDAATAGMKVGVYSITSRYRAALWISRGVHMVMSDSPVYIDTTSTRHRRNTDPFKLQTWYHGMIPAGNGRGTFVSPKWHRSPNTGLHYVLAGFLCPIPDPNNWTLNFAATLDASSTTTDWIALSFSAEDDQPSAAQVGGRNNAYAALYRRDGRMQIYRETRPNSATLLAEITTAPTFAIGEELALQVIVTPTVVTFRRQDAGGEVSVADTTRRGSYIFYGRGASAGVQASFADMVLA